MIEGILMVLFEVLFLLSQACYLGWADPVLWVHLLTLLSRLYTPVTVTR